MRIVLDVRYRTRSGAASYIDNILPGLLAAGSGHDFVILRFESQTWFDDLDCEIVTLNSGSAAGQALLDQIALPRLLRRLGANVYHPMKHLGTVFPPCAQVVTAHSITLPFRGVFPVGNAEAIYWSTLGTQIFRRSAALIAVSEFVRDFLIEKIGIDPSRISVIHHGVDARFRHSPITAKQGGGEDYLLTVGNIFPVKNFVTAVKVFAAVAREWPNLRLKMAGSMAHPYFQEVKSLVARAGLSEKVDFLGFTTPSNLVHLFNQARLLLMPSLTEGCPVTLIEAMACGLPVIGSARGGIPEVGGDAVVLIGDPYDVPSWVDATRELLRDQERWNKLQTSALTRSLAFRWPTAVRATLDVYASVDRRTGAAGGAW